MLFKYFENRLYYDNDAYSAINVSEENDIENSDKDDIIYKNLEKELETLIFDNSSPSIIENKCNYQKNKRNHNKKRIKKMKNYNIKKGDWQCMNCFNINFHFRTKCNICQIPK